MRTFTGTPMDLQPGDYVHLGDARLECVLHTTVVAGGVVVTVGRGVSWTRLPAMATNARIDISR